MPTTPTHAERMGQLIESNETHAEQIAELTQIIKNLAAQVSALAVTQAVNQEQIKALTARVDGSENRERDAAMRGDERSFLQSLNLGNILAMLAASAITAFVTWLVAHPH